MQGARRLPRAAGTGHHTDRLFLLLGGRGVGDRGNLLWVYQQVPVHTRNAKPCVSSDAGGSWFDAAGLLRPCRPVPRRLQTRPRDQTALAMGLVGAWRLCGTASAWV